MENQHRKIAGYRELSQAEIDVMNEIKQVGEDVLKPLVEKLALLARPICSTCGKRVAPKDAVAWLGHDATHVSAEACAADDPAYGLDGVHVDGRWLAIGRTHLQEGLMALTRSVTRPDFF